MVQGATGAIGAGVLWMVAGAQPAVAFLAGSAVIAIAFALFGWRTSGRPRVASAARMFMRLLVGTGLKWMSVAAGVVLAIAGFGLPAGFVLAGVLSALLLSVIALPWLLR